ncbi:LysR substrate-binding domain-containing protein [Rhodococcus sp. NPDC003318]|uniref:LysR substrate-binding domain-containing protein n=1 Tax=Rhodococcus sp. NPDC003318 TaxID=3364503 RepID=UPI0036A30127
MTGTAKPPAYTMRQLFVFVAVAETGTIRAAADRLHVSQSAVSLALTELERGLRSQLCVRRRAHGVQLTPTGERVLVRARALLEQAGDLAAAAAGAEGELTGPLAIGCYSSLGPTLLPRLLYEFNQQHPRVTVDFVEDNQDRLDGRLTSGELDLAIVYDLDLSPALHRTRMDTRQPAILLPSGHRLADAPVLELAELAEEPMVLLDAPPSSFHALQTCNRAGFTPRIRYRPKNFETARALVGRGLGWTLLIQRPQYDVTYEGLGLVVRHEVNPPIEPVDILLAWSANVLLSKAARAFIDFASADPRPDLQDL